MPARRPATQLLQRERDATIVAAFKAEPRLTYAALGLRFGLCESRICHIIRNARAQRGRAAQTAARDAAILRMSLQSPSPTLVNIGLHFGLCATSVRRAIQRAERHEAMLADCRNRKAVRRRAAPQKTGTPEFSTPASSIPEPMPVFREPCPFCGVRGDIGCHHRSVSQ